MVRFFSGPPLRAEAPAGLHFVDSGGAMVYTIARDRSEDQKPIRTHVEVEEEFMVQKKDSDVERKVAGPGAEEDPESTKATIQWDVSKMQSTYANVCNVSCTREEFTLLFGMNKTWDAGQRKLTVDMTDRIILSPYAAKRLSIPLGNVISQYQSRFGEIHLDMAEKSGLNA